MPLRQNLRYAVRVLQASPGFTAVGVFTLALGIGANTALFSVLDVVMIKSLPVEDPDRLVLLSLRNARGESNMSFSYPVFAELRARNHTLSGLFATPGGDRMPFRVPPSGETEAAFVSMVSSDSFQVLGVEAQLGRALTAADDQPPGGHPVAVLSNRFWKSRFGGSPSVIGKEVFIQDVAFTIVGVGPPGFFGNAVGELPEIWVPLTMQPQLWRGRNYLDAANITWLVTMGRLQPGVSLAQAQADLRVILQQIAAKIGRVPESAALVLMPGSRGHSELRERFERPLTILMGVVGLVLLIACVNVANLLMARAVARQHEIAIRVALGAGRWHLTTQFLAESLLLALLGGGLGLLLAFWGTDALLPLLADRGRAPVLAVPVDLRLLAFTTMISVAAGLLFGIVPALRAAAQTELVLPKGGAARTPRLAASKMLVVFQVALSLLLVVSAGLFVRTLQKLRSIDAGFDRQHVLLLRLDAVATGYKDPPLADVYRRLLAEVAAVPGVRSASLSGVGLLGGRSRTCCITVPGYTPAAGERMEIRTNEVTPSYFGAVGMTLREGRNFTEQDRAAKRQLVIVNEAFARRYFNGRPAVGRSFSFGKDYMMQIVGVVRDARYDGLREPAPPLVFFPVTDNLDRLQSLEVRAAGDPRAVGSLVQRVVAKVEPRLPVREATTIAQLVDSSLAQERLMARLSGFFGALALGLACLGIYGLMAHLVARRTNEIGIRMALGADRRQVVGMVLREATFLVAPGAAIGIAAVLASTRLVASLLFGITPTDPVTLGIATAVLAVAALAAGYLPARRAASIEPMAALRHE